jgi:hypothetical protein
VFKTIAASANGNLTCQRKKVHYYNDHYYSESAGFMVSTRIAQPLSSPYASTLRATRGTMAPPIRIRGGHRTCGGTHEPRTCSHLCRTSESTDISKFGAMPNFILDHRPTEETYGNS